MSLETTTNIETYHGDGTASQEFPIPFGFFLKSDIVVTRITVADGTRLLLTLDTNYSVSTTNSTYEDGGTVTGIDTFTSAYDIEVLRIEPLTQETVNTKYDDFDSKAEERSLELKPVPRISAISIF